MFLRDILMRMRHYIFRKDDLSPARTKEPAAVNSPNGSGHPGGASFRTSLRGSLTVESAVVVPVFLVCMLAVIHYGNVCGTAARFGGAMAQTTEEMAIAAYAKDYGDSDSLTIDAISAFYGQARIMALAGNTKPVKSANILLSPLFTEEDEIDLVLTYQVRSPVGIVRIPGHFFVQRAVVRGWTGRKGSGGTPSSDGSSGKEDSTVVYVTDHGTVYHKDPQCTHIHLSIQEVDTASVGGRRNVYGACYHKCEYCGSHPGGSVYITTDGNRYHTTLDCPGLTRTVHPVHMDEVGEKRPCSRCGGKEDE